MNNYVNSKWIIGLIGLVIVAFFVWIIAGTSDSDINEEVLGAQETYTAEDVTEADTGENEIENGYFYVKAVDGSVFVYWIDGTGEHLHQETSISYALLSSEDQKLLENGVRIESEEELSGFLENYDS